ncbi:hypothetical protein BVX98_05750 [bacterium F11]|nr:hypothetical protein BVX98_05750 [bacterium F11]
MRRENIYMISLSLTIFLLVSGIQIPNSARGESVNKIRKIEAKPLEAYKKALVHFLKNHPTAADWEIISDESNNSVYTNWFTEHKGERRLKVKITLNRDLYRVDVRHNMGWFFEKPRITEWSQQTEWAIQNAIEDLVFNR